MLCEYDATLQCRLCGHIARRLPTFRQCTGKRISVPRFAVGSAIERMLTAIGITKERVQEWTRTKDCGCAARQRWLDQWGYAQQERLERLLNRAAKFYFGGSLDAPATVAGERDADAPQATQGSEA